MCLTKYLASDAPDSTYVAHAPLSLRVEDAIELTHQAGGIAVLAHPGSYTRIHDIDQVVRHLRQAGLDGLKCAIPTRKTVGITKHLPQWSLP